VPLRRALLPGTLGVAAARPDQDSGLLRLRLVHERAAPEGCVRRVSRHGPDTQTHDDRPAALAVAPLGGLSLRDAALVRPLAEGHGHAGDGRPADPALYPRRRYMAGGARGAGAAHRLAWCLSPGAPPGGR